jgi:signal transduction histidine kinase
MSPAKPNQVLVHTPYGKDASIICQVLERSGIAGVACQTLEELCGNLGQDTGAALISDQSITKSSVSALTAIIGAQPPWSDLPLIITTSGGEANDASRRQLALLEPLGNVSLLERPLRVVTLVSAVRIALRTRERQFQLRDNFTERTRLVEELERSNSELAQFAHIVSHDLQAPIRMVKIFTELLGKTLGEQLDSKTAKYLSTIQEGASTMETLVRSLLNYATVGQEPLSPSNVELRSVVTAVVETLAPNIQELQAKVTCGSLPLVYGDSIQLRQLMQNLIGNALKYSKPGAPPRINISALEFGHRWKVSVSDNGPGIPAEFHDKVFLPLKRLHGNNIAGTGMGLAVCRKIVERHGGEIWVDSAPGNGATFSFTLPGSTT